MSGGHWAGAGETATPCGQTGGQPGEEPALGTWPWLREMEVRSPQRKEHSPLHVRPRPQTLFSSTTQDGKAGPCVLSNQDTSRRPQGTCEVSTFAISAPKGPGRFTGTSGRPRPSWTFLLGEDSGPAGQGGAKEAAGSVVITSKGNIFILLLLLLLCLIV